MKIIHLSLVPDKDVPEFKRMELSIIDRPLREVLLNGLHPVGLARGFDGYCDTSGLAEVVAERLNRQEHTVPGLKEFGHSYDISAPPKQKYYPYMPAEGLTDNAWDALRSYAQNTYMVDDLSYPGLVGIARRRLRSGWSPTVAREMLVGKYWGFNEQRRFLKEKSVTATFKSRSDIDQFDLSEVLTVEDFRNDDKLLVSHGIPGAVNFRLCQTVRSFTTEDGVVSVVPRIDRFQMRIAMPGEHNIHSGNSVRYRCRLKEGLVRLTPELQMSDDRHCREKAGRLARELASGREQYCFGLKIEEVERLLPRSQLFFPELNYVERSKDGQSLASIRSDMAVTAFSVGAPVTSRVSNAHLAELLAAHGEKISGTKDELIERLVTTVSRLYKKSRRKLDRYFGGGFLRLPEGLTARTTFDPPIPDHGLRTNVIALYVLKHLRGSRILSPDWENTAYTVEDLARALMGQRVTADGVFVRAGET